MKKFLLKMILLGCLLVFCSCGKKADEQDNKVEDEPDADITEQSEEESPPDIEELLEEKTEQIDLSSYYDGINGCAVFYTPSDNHWQIWNEELAGKESSPCSTFKIISTLFGLEAGVIDSSDSVRTWKGTEFWKKEWNQDIALEEAFAESCIWYYREVIDEIGAENMQDMLDELDYGNGDISDWEGLQNTNNSYMELRGFWVESSLKISPYQQAEVVYRIFESDMYDEQNLILLKQLMQVESEDDSADIYGKTGTGIKAGQCIDAWFTGMFEKDGIPTYFSVRLDDPENEDSSGAKAKEIALSVIRGYFN